uniref:Uncharacterized protein n=1 Tax=Fagus sylvatica TaxID=28930 RepID=A0A2N9FDM4_FAGSY
MAPKKSVSSEDPRKKRLKSKASRDEPPSLDKSFASSEYLILVVKKRLETNAPVMEQVGEEAQMDEAEAEAAGNEEPMQEDQEPRSAPSSSSRINEDNFQLVLGRLDSLATSMGNIQTSIDNFSAMVTRKFSTYDEQFGTLETSIQEINERLINQGI